MSHQAFKNLLKFVLLLAALALIISALGLSVLFSIMLRLSWSLDIVWIAFGIASVLWVMIGTTLLLMVALPIPDEFDAP